MRTYIGWWLMSKEYTNVEDIPRDQVPETVEGAVQIRYDMISRNRAKTMGIEVSKVTEIIEVDTRVNIKPDDRVYVGTWLRVETVDTRVPKEKEAIVRMWANRRSAVEVKVVTLV